MEFGFSTILWGDPFQTPVPEVFSLIRQAGFTAVEFGQRPAAALRCRVRTSADLHQRAQAAGLRLLGLGTGNPETLTEFCGDDRSLYLTCSNWTPAFKDALDQGFRVAIHPRVFRRIQRIPELQRILDLHKDNPHLGAILDTADLYLSGEKPVDAIRGFCEEFGVKRLFAVHLKDWTSEFGHSLYWHARGFTTLGDGEVGIAKVLEYLQEIRYPGPVVVDLENLWLDPQPTLLRCAQWLSLHELIGPITPDSPPDTSTPIWQRVLPFGTRVRTGRVTDRVPGTNTLLPNTDRTAEMAKREAELLLRRTGQVAEEARLWREILDASRPPTELFYGRLVEAVAKWAGEVDSVTLRICVLTQDTLRWLAQQPAGLGRPMQSLPINDSMTGWALDDGASVVCQDPRKPNPHRRFFYGENEELPHQVMRLTTLPIRVSGNPTFPHLVLDIYYDTRKLLIPKRSLRYLSQIIGIASDWVLDAECLLAAEAVHRLTGEMRARPLDAFLQGVCDRVRRRLVPCEGVSIWLPDDAEQELTLGATTNSALAQGGNWPTYARDAPNLTSYAWRHKEVLLDLDGNLRSNLDLKPPRSYDSDSAGDNKRWVVLVPWIDSDGRVQAIIRCNNKLQGMGPEWGGMFSYEDASVLDAVGQAALPHIREARAEAERAGRLGELSHELRRPTGAILGHTEAMLAAPTLPPELRAHVTEMRCTALEMQLLVQNAEVFRGFPRPVGITPTRVHLYNDVLLPVLQDWRPILTQRGLEIEALCHPSLRTAPELQVDGPKIELVLRNLLQNALLHAGSQAPRVQFSLERHLDRFDLILTDEGEGLPEGTPEALLRAGVRDQDDPGRSLGLGLWVADQVMRAHGGQIVVTSRARPTRIALAFPRSLVMNKPDPGSQDQGGDGELRSKAIHSKVRFAFSTIAWGPRFETQAHLEAALSEIAQQGFTGVEFFQGPRALGGVSSARELVQVVQKYGLEYVGMFGGTWEEREDFFQENLREPPDATSYWGLTQWNGPTAPPSTAPCRRAIHAHAFRPEHQHKDALERLKADPTLYYLPDTAHLLIEALDPAAAIRELLEMASGAGRAGHPIAAVHLKDCRIGPGRISHRYPRGFVELGEGDVRLVPVLVELERKHYNGWVVVEVNSPTESTAASLEQCARWLRKRGYPMTARKDVPEPQATSESPPSDLAPELEREWLTWMLEAAVEEPRECYRHILAAARSVFGSDMATWTVCNLHTDEITVAAVDPTDLDLQVVPRTFPVSGRLSEGPIRHHRVDMLDLDLPHNAERVLHSNLVQARWMYILPVLNTRNPNHVRCLLQLYWKSEPPALREAQWFHVAQLAARAVEASIESRCARLVARVHHLAGRHPDLEHFLKTIVVLVKETLQCDGVSLFLTDDLDRMLECPTGGTTGITWRDPTRRWYLRGERFLGKAWATGQPVLYRQRQDEVTMLPLSSDLPGGTAPDSALCAPLFNHRGDVAGVMRCSLGSQGATPQNYRGFTDEDLALLEVILHTTVNHVLFLRGGERREYIQDSLQHVLNESVRNIRHGLIELRGRQRELKWSWEHPYPTDIRAWCSRLERLTHPEEAVPTGPVGTVRLFNEVIAPIVRELGPDLRQRGLPAGRFDFEALRNVPVLQVDFVEIHGIFFNLLENTVKYAGARRGAFRVVLKWERQGEYVVIHVSDWGIGIAEELRDRVFEKEFRAEEAKNLNREGQGLGLYMVREALRRIGGRVELTHGSQPTTFSLYFPVSLVS